MKSSFLILLVCTALALQANSQTLGTLGEFNNAHKSGQAVQAELGATGSVEASNFVKDIVGATNALAKHAQVAGMNIEKGGESTRQLQNASALYKTACFGVVLLIATDGSSLGAGCVISDQGEIVTNWHVVQAKAAMLVVVYDKNKTNIEDLGTDNMVVGTVVAANPKKDLALLRAKLSPNARTIVLGRNDKIEVAQDVFAIGHPESYIWSFTYGVISGLRNQHEWEYSDGSKFKADIIQTQTPINPGNSGGPLFNDKGELIGINSFRSASAEGLNFAVRVDEIGAFVHDARNGKYRDLASVNRESAVPEKWDKLDRNGNGVTDAEGYDGNHDGKYEVVVEDSDEDGHPDKIIADTNNDGYIDMEVTDRDGDGKFEYFILDTNYDYKWDTIGIDTDGDMKPDKFSKYLG